MKFIAIIPARYASSRLPGKPLIDLCGKPMIQHVYERALPLVDEVWIATDDDRIVEAVNKFHGNVVFTSHNCTSGTDRVYQAYQLIRGGRDEDVMIINIQGDEPLLHKQHITRLKSKILSMSYPSFVTLAYPMVVEKVLKNLDFNTAYVVLNNHNNAMYFSRWPIPYMKTRYLSEKELNAPVAYKHLGIYAYTPATLKAFTALAPSFLEKCESLEQNRWLENNGTIAVAFTTHDTVSVDTPEDVLKVIKIMNKKNK